MWHSFLIQNGAKNTTWIQRFAIWLHKLLSLTVLCNHTVIHKCRYLRPGWVWNEIGAVALVPSWLKTDKVTQYSIPGTVSTICWVALPSSWYCWAIVPLENSTMTIRDSALSSACWCVRDHVTSTWELVVFDTLTFEGRAGGTAEVKETHSVYDNCQLSANFWVK